MMRPHVHTSVARLDTSTAHMCEGKAHAITARSNTPVVTPYLSMCDGDLVLELVDLLVDVGDACARSASKGVRKRIIY